MYTGLLIFDYYEERVDRPLKFCRNDSVMRKSYTIASYQGLPVFFNVNLIKFHMGRPGYETKNGQHSLKKVTIVCQYR